MHYTLEYRFVIDSKAEFGVQVLERAKEAMDLGKWEECTALIAQSNLLFQRGSAKEAEHKAAAQLLSKLHSARDVFDTRARGLEALAAGAAFPLSFSPFLVTSSVVGDMRSPQLSKALHR